MDKMVLWPVARGGHVVFGSLRVKAGCGHEAWLAPSSSRLIAETPMETVCDDCMVYGPGDQLVVDHSQRTELVRELGSESTADEVIESGMRTFEQRREQ